MKEVRWKTIKLPFGLNENNMLVHVDEVERGKKCNCVCPGCGSSLIASKGRKNQPHFKHAANNECDGGLESAIHLAAKKMILERKQITLPKLECVVTASDSRGISHKKRETIVKEAMSIKLDFVQEEAELNGIRADLLAEKNNTRLIIEIFFRHKVDDQKLEKITSSNVSAIEINLSDLNPKEVQNWEVFWACLNDPERVRWLYNAKVEGTRSELEKQLEKTIQEKEEEYRRDEIKRQKKGQLEKEQLLQALNELKDLSSEESISRIKQEAEMSPVWKYISKDFPFSWDELPDFLNLDVSNSDWIFGCDRRIWQIAFYKNFILGKDKPFSIKIVDNFLQNAVGCKVPLSVKNVGRYSKRYPELVPISIYSNTPGSWKTLREYFNYLSEFGMLEFSGDDYHNPGNIWFRVTGKKKPELPLKRHHRLNLLKAIRS